MVPSSNALESKNNKGCYFGYISVTISTLAVQSSHSIQSNCRFSVFDRVMVELYKSLVLKLLKTSYA